MRMMFGFSAAWREKAKRQVRKRPQNFMAGRVGEKWRDVQAD
jgi:hypothetical protein